MFVSRLNLPCHVHIKEVEEIQWEDYCFKAEDSDWWIDLGQERDWKIKFFPDEILIVSKGKSWQWYMEWDEMELWHFEFVAH